MLTIEDVLGALRVKRTRQREELIKKAYEFSQKAHKGQKRISGEPYIQHSLHTAMNLAHIGMASKTISAGLLHDVLEDTGKTLKDIEGEFGKEIAFIVDGVTKLGHLKLRESKEEFQLENLRKMFLAMAKDIRVVIIRLADRLHNMETLEIQPLEKQRRIALETIEIYAPIANRLGIGEIKGRLEDLSFKYLDPKNYEYISKLEEKEYKERKKFIERAVKELKEELEKENIKVVEIFGRNKRVYRLFQKMKRYDMDINKIYDLAGVRIIVPQMPDCYETLGIVHKKYRPLVGRIKDYISLPKPNGYQSIHTTIFGPEGRILEVQIRTPRMDDEAEFGIASHWLYSEDQENRLTDFFLRKSSKKKKKKIPIEEVLWIKQLREWQTELGKDDVEFVKTLKLDFFRNQIFAFTPRGEVIELPEESTPIDFAYKIHSEVGNRATGAKANNRIVPFEYKIKNGDVIEILTSKENKKPSRSWLDFVKTSTAKSNIRKFYKQPN